MKGDGAERGGGNAGVLSGMKQVATGEKTKTGMTPERKKMEEDGGRRDSILCFDTERKKRLRLFWRYRRRHKQKDSKELGAGKGRKKMKRREEEMICRKILAKTAPSSPFSPRKK